MSVAKHGAAHSSNVISQEHRAVAQERLASQNYLRGLRQQAPSRSLDTLPVLAFGLDLIAIASTFTVAVWGRNALGFSAPGLGSQLAVAAPFIALGWIVSIAVVGGYQTKVFGAGTDEYRRIMRASFVTAAITGIASFVTKFDLSRGFYVLTLLLGPPALLLGRLCLRRVL